MLEKWRLDLYNRRQDSDFEELELVDLIYTMPETYRDPMYMFYVHKYTVNEIANLLGISNAAVRKRLERARLMLKGMIGESHGNI